MPKFATVLYFSIGLQQVSLEFRNTHLVGILRKFHLEFHQTWNKKIFGLPGVTKFDAGLRRWVIPRYARPIGCLLQSHLGIFNWTFKDTIWLCVDLLKKSKFILKLFFIQKWNELGPFTNHWNIWWPFIIAILTTTPLKWRQKTEQHKTLNSGEHGGWVF